MNSRLTYAPQQEAQARSICTALGPGWILRQASAQPDEWHDWHLRRVADGLELDLSWPDGYVREKAEQRDDQYSKKDLRLTIAGVWPRDHDQQPAIPTRTELGAQVTSISVDLAKPAETIAKDLQRRLLGSFEPLYRRSVEIIRSRNAYHDLTEATIARILREVPGAHRGQHSSGAIYLGEASHAYGLHVQGDSVRLEAFSCPVAQAIAALRALAKGRPAEVLVCERCFVEISEAQAGLSHARGVDAPAWCADCVSASLTQQAAGAPPLVDCETCHGSQCISVDGRVVDCPNPTCYQGYKHAAGG